jgi:hypothetical protein
MENPMRRAAKPDANQHALVEALKKIGAKCFYIKEPVDLLVGYRGRNLLLEVKNREGKNRITKAQAEFLATWPGDVQVVWSVEEAISAVVGPS